MPIASALWQIVGACVLHATASTWRKLFGVFTICHFAGFAGTKLGEKILYSVFVAIVRQGQASELL